MCVDVVRFLGRDHEQPTIELRFPSVLWFSCLNNNIKEK